jgi:hypothetical protein
MASNTTIFEPANRAIIEDIKKELRDQGHYLTGALEASLQEREVAENGGVTLTAEALAYIEDLEKGLAPNQIDFSAAGIQKMTRYVELRMGYSGKYAVKVAIRILKKQLKEGNPTKNSYQYSKTGFRTEAVRDVFDSKSNRYIGMIDDAAIGSLDQSFHTIKSGTI